MDYKLKDKIVLITGAAQGIGLATAQEFTKAGAVTIMADIRKPEQEAASLTSGGYRALAIQCDVSKEQDVKT